MLKDSDREWLRTLAGGHGLSLGSQMVIGKAHAEIERLEKVVQDQGRTILRLETEARERSPSRWADDGEDTRKCSPDALTLRLLDQQANTCARLFNILEAACAAKGGGDR